MYKNLAITAVLARVLASLISFAPPWPVLNGGTV